MPPPLPAEQTQGGVTRLIIAVAVVNLAAATAICSSSRAKPTATGLTDADAARIVGTGAAGYRMPPTRDAGSPDRVDRRPAAMSPYPIDSGPSTGEAGISARALKLPLAGAAESGGGRCQPHLYIPQAG